VIEDPDSCDGSKYFEGLSPPWSEWMQYLSSSSRLVLTQILYMYIRIRHCWNTED
jgi:hypothetical protein